MKQTEPGQELLHSVQNHGKLGTYGEARANHTVVLFERQETHYLLSIEGGTPGRVAVYSLLVSMLVGRDSSSATRSNHEHGLAAASHQPLSTLLITFWGINFTGINPMNV